MTMEATIDTVDFPVKQTQGKFLFIFRHKIETTKFCPEKLKLQNHLSRKS